MHLCVFVCVCVCVCVNVCVSTGVCGCVAEEGGVQEPTQRTCRGDGEGGAVGGEAEGCRIRRLQLVLYLHSV